MGVKLSKTARQRENAQKDGAQAAIAAGVPVDELGAGEFEEQNPDLKFGVGLRKREERKKQSIKRKERLKGKKIPKVKNVQGGTVDLAD
ncbi:hypothetical protein ACEPAF_1603 [Sanghuangporus sanghuang]